MLVLWFFNKKNYFVNDHKSWELKQIRNEQISLDGAAKSTRIVFDHKVYWGWKDLIF